MQSAMGEKFARFFINIFISLTASLEVHGLEHMQGLQSYILASNHVGRLDALLIYRFSNRRDIIMLVAEKYRKSRITRWFVHQLDGVFIERFNADFTVLRQVLNRLKKGGVLVLAPEGTRSPNAQLQEAWPGASFLAAKANVPVLPVGLAGSEDALFFHNLKHLRRTRVVVRAGEPFTLPPTDGLRREDALKKNTDEIMCQIAALLPPPYRGVYADHPRLKELLDAS